MMAATMIPIRELSMKALNAGEKNKYPWNPLFACVMLEPSSVEALVFMALILLLCSCEGA